MCPQVFSAELYKTSGHYDNFHEDFFLFPGSEEGEELGIKPMNCPGHCLVFRSKKRSYRELPLRLAEFSRLHRNERTGSLHGLTRVRSMAQDDGHILRVGGHRHRDRPVHAMTAEVSRAQRRAALRRDAPGQVHRPHRGLGPRREAARRRGSTRGLRVRDQAARARSTRRRSSATSRTCSADVAVDDPSRHGDARALRPALHRRPRGARPRAVFGRSSASSPSMSSTPAASRSSPQQVVVLPVSDRQHAYARASSRIACANPACAPRPTSATRLLNYRVRAAETQRSRYVLVVGEREQEAASVSVRRRHVSGQTVLPFDRFQMNIQKEIRTRGIS